MPRIKRTIRRTISLFWTALTLVTVTLAVMVGLGKLLLPYSERFQPNGIGPYTSRKQIIRDSRYKYWRRFINGSVVAELLYDLEADPLELTDLSADPGSSATLQAFRAEAARRFPGRHRVDRIFRAGKRRVRRRRFS